MPFSILLLFVLASVSSEAVSSEAVAPYGEAPAAGAAPAPTEAVPGTPVPAPAAVPAADEKEIELGWSGTLGAGATLSTGNTERTSAHANADAVLRRERDRFTLGAYWNYASEENDEGESAITERRLGGRFKYDYFLTEKSYALFNSSAETDDRADLQLRATAGLGYGYQWYEEEARKLSTELGVNWVHEDYEGESPDEYLAGRFAYDAMKGLREKWTLQQTGELLHSLDDGDDVNSKLDTRARYAYSSNLFAQLQWVWDWDNTPAADKERSDHRFLLSVGYSF